MRWHPCSVDISIECAMESKKELLGMRGREKGAKKELRSIDWSVCCRCCCRRYSYIHFVANGAKVLFSFSGRHHYAVEWDIAKEYSPNAYNTCFDKLRMLTICFFFCYRFWLEKGTERQWEYLLFFTCTSAVLILFIDAFWICLICAHACVFDITSIRFDKLDFSLLCRNIARAAHTFCTPSIDSLDWPYGFASQVAGRNVYDSKQPSISWILILFEGAKDQQGSEPRISSRVLKTDCCVFSSFYGCRWFYNYHWL